MSRVIELLARLVQVDTVNDPVRGKRVDISKGSQIAEILAEEWGSKPLIIERMGFPSLVYVRGSGAPVTLVMAHIDTVPPGPGWDSDPFEFTIKGDRAYGRGAADDKGNVAAITMALRDYYPENGTIVVAFTSDEEIGGRNGAGYLRDWLRDNGLWPNYLVNGDGSLSRIINRRRNAFNVVLRVKSEKDVVDGCPESRTYSAVIREKETMHAAYFTPGVDTHPLIQAAELVRLKEYPVISIHGEWVKSNVIPHRVTVKLASDRCSETVEVDIGLTRLLKALIPLTRPVINTLYYSDYGITATPNVYRLVDGWHEVVIDVRAMAEAGQVGRAYEAIAGEVLAGVEYSIEVRGGGGYLYTSKASRLVSIASSINRGLGLPGEPIEAGGASDSRYFSPEGVESIDYGPLGGNVHGPNEYVYISALEKTIVFYRRVIEKLHMVGV